MQDQITLDLEKVEKILKNIDNSIISFKELKNKVPNITFNKLKEILEFLEDDGKIIITKKGITWIHNQNKNLIKAIENSMEL